MRVKWSRAPLSLFRAIIAVIILFYSGSFVLCKGLTVSRGRSRQRSVSVDGVVNDTLQYFGSERD